MESLDADSTVEWVAGLKLDGGKLAWEPIALQEPRRKGHQIVAYLNEEPRPWQSAYVAESDGAVLGFAAVGLQPWNSRLVLWHMYVDATARRRGVAKLLLDAVLGSDLAVEARQLWLETQDDNVPAIRAYERLGFEVVGFDRSYYANPPDADTAIFMSRALPPGRQHSAQ